MPCKLLLLLNVLYKKKIATCYTDSEFHQLTSDSGWITSLLVRCDYELNLDRLGLCNQGNYTSKKLNRNINFHFVTTVLHVYMYYYFYVSESSNSYDDYWWFSKQNATVR